MRQRVGNAQGYLGGPSISYYFSSRNRRLSDGRDGRDRSGGPYSSETIFFALGMEGALIESSVTPSSMSFGIMAGSPAASPHIPTQIPASRAASQVFFMSSKTAG